MPTKHEAILKRRDVYELDPRKIEIEAGWNPRKDFGNLNELKASIIENGVVEPITVKMIGERIILVDGERRLRAALEAIGEGHEIVSVPAIIARRTISDLEALVLALLKNDGKPLLPTEEAEAFRRLVAWGLTQAEIAKRIGKSQPYVSERMALIDAIPEVKAAVDQKTITKKAARDIVKKSEGSIQEQRRGLERERSGERGSNVDGFKSMPRKSIERLLVDYRNTSQANLNEYARAFNEGVIAGLSMVFYNSEKIDPKWINKQ